MVGSATEAEDLVQEAFLRFHRASSEGTEIESPKAYLAAVTTRLSIDHLRSARVRREQYVGPWLPEPLLTDAESDAAVHAETADSLSLAFLVLLESLSPLERAVFLLREVFDYGYDEIARVVARSEDSCRQLAVRARRHVEARRPRFEASRKQREELAQRFFIACEEGNMDALEDLLAADVVFTGDGGGVGPGITKPVHGRDPVTRLLAGFAKQAGRVRISWRPAEVNGQPGAMFLDPDGGLVCVIALDIADGLVQGIHSVVNPEKLRHLAPVGDLARLLGRSSTDS
jgi:RNA polymerase sigma-70 factor (ECF subfamily)